MSDCCSDNELSYFESIHLFVEVLDQFFGSVCELDLVFNFYKVTPVHAANYCECNAFRCTLFSTSSFWPAKCRKPASSRFWVEFANLISSSR